MALNLSPHNFSVNPETNQPVLTRIQAYVRVREGDSPPLFLQGGQVYSEGGPLIPAEDWPDWLEGHIKRLSPLALEECGFRDWVQNLNKPLEQKPKK